ncbi:FtsK/SpoIIIE domain-containing protein [Planktothricoides raciborskii]|uniref:AAA family ATPase n=1 Tax=Planktothricoides raciborskii FACHB-1370 TaxID=2949576 RepID=A0ABR8EMN2_9CYAN|nr:FtsK/SpoIIIE domain-containing protein [Planktothricoides raciborskii]MBD2546827.1 AAA family ATPase [Planktothricoides raciborskii FACHB-1370]MBD2585299.1 AAA family ATPase [Planktothricoides raciborskii FACHB-1261]
MNLKPISKLVTAQEISGFFCVAVPKNTLNQDMKTNIPVANAEELFKYYKGLLAQDPDTYRDTYIIGINDTGEPVISSWAETPHRLLAGVPGSGKTNFLNWVIFQFIYANPKGKIYIADFTGVDFQFLVKRLNANVEIITNIEEYQQLVEKLHREEYQKRMNLLETHEVQNIQQLREEGVEIERTLWIIDEAADIAHASYNFHKLKDQIENRLSEYARKGRKLGLHLIYCTQRPSIGIITPQVLDCCEERVVFRVSETVSELIAGTPRAGRIPKEALGRAFLKNVGGGDNNGFVNTPFIQVPVGKKVNLSDTLWQNCVLPSSGNAEDLFKYYKGLLEQDPDTYRDTYIIGINDAGEPVISSWAETPHRLVTGVPGAGKTNFLNWVIFQFIYANPKGKIYIADFTGVDFQFLVKRLNANVEIITTIEEYQQLVEKLHREEYQKRMNLLETHEVQNIQQLREEGVEIERTLWIIDEAADIAHASHKLKEQIENRLSEYARKGRKCGFHVIYCTQRPSTGIITPQVLDCFDERVVFRVNETVSESIAGTPQAGRIPKEARGRAFLKNLGGGDNNGFVNTPYIEVLVGKKVNLSDTLWQNCVKLSN